jgi:hypothetical protein
MRSAPSLGPRTNTLFASPGGDTTVPSVAMNSTPAVTAPPFPYFRVRVIAALTRCAITLTRRCELPGSPSSAPKPRFTPEADGWGCAWGVLTCSPVPAGDHFQTHSSNLGSTLGTRVALMRPQLDRLRADVLSLSRGQHTRGQRSADVRDTGAADCRNGVRDLPAGVDDAGAATRAADPRWLL